MHRRALVRIGGFSVSSVLKSVPVKSSPLPGIVLVGSLAAECRDGAADKLVLIHEHSGLCLLEFSLTHAEMMYAVGELSHADWELPVTRIGTSPLHCAIINQIRKEILIRRPGGAIDKMNYRSGHYSNKQKSGRREKWLAEQLGMQMVAGSGSVKGSPRDLRDSMFMLEDKHLALEDVEDPRHTMKGEDLEYLYGQAAERGLCAAYTYGIGSLNIVFIPLESLDTDALPMTEINVTRHDCGDAKSCILRMRLFQSLQEMKPVESETADGAGYKGMVCSRLHVVTVMGREWVGMGFRFFLRNAKQFIYV